MSTSDPAKKLATLLHRLRSRHAGCTLQSLEAPPNPGGDAIVEQLLLAFLAWESCGTRAAASLKRLHSVVVDYNELRVCLPDEIAEACGDRDPRALERGARMKAALNDLYRREHGVTLAPLAALPKRDARLYLESLEGVPSYVAARVLLVSLGGHAFPVDVRIHAALCGAGGLPEGLDPEGAGAWLERHFRAGEAGEAFALVEAWVGETATTKERRTATRARAARPSKRQGKA